MTNLTELSVREFADLLASSAPAPGGGAAAALEGALGASLVSMVCELTIGREKYADFQDLAADTAAKAKTLKDRFLELMQEDAESYSALMAAFAMPKETEEEKAVRAAEVQKGLEGCIQSPLALMECAEKGLGLIAAVLGKSNRNAESDLGVAAESFRTAMRNAWLNVRINLRSLKDRSRAAEYESKAKAILERALFTAEEAYTRVVSDL